MHTTDYIHRSFRLLVIATYHSIVDTVSILFCRTVLFEELDPYFNSNTMHQCSLQQFSRNLVS